MNHVPGDIKELLPWLNIIRRLRSVSHTRGYAVLTIHVVVKPGGKLVTWTAPSVTLLEPWEDAAAVDVLLTTLAP